MKGLKCVFSLLSITLLLGCVLCSDSSALKYPINTIPISSDTYQFRKVQDYYTGDDIYTYFVKYQGFSIKDGSGVTFPSDFSFPHTYNFTGVYNPSTNSCVLPTPSNNGSKYYSDGAGSSYGAGSDTHFYSYRPPQVFVLNSNPHFVSSNIFGQDSPFSNSSSFYSQAPDFFSSGTNSSLLCQIYDYSYINSGDSVPPAYTSYPTWDWSSLINIPLVNNRLSYESSKPFTYNYNVLKINGTEKGSDGIVYNKSGIKMSDIFNTNIPTFSSMTFHFNEFNEPSSWLSPEDSDDPSTEDVYTFDLSGSISFDSDYTLGSRASILMNVRNYYNPYISSSDLSSSLGVFNGHTVYYLPSVTSDITCSYTEYHTSNGDSSNRLDFVCHYDPVSANAYTNKINFKFLDFSLSFTNTGTYYNANPFLDSTSGDYLFHDFNIITNNNDTPSGWSGSSSGSGGNMSSAPGDNGYDSEGIPDYFASLTTLFNFNFINPFAPLFGLFTSNDSCVNIPTLSGMLHSEETQVCPWFDSTTRNIVTPVLGLSSMMLVFGFAVRWLGSSSGNMFTDSQNEEVSNQGGRWGHFKKGGA